MLMNRLIRLTARSLGAMGRPLGLPHRPLWQGVYGRMAQYVLPDSDVRALVDGQTMLLPSPKRNTLSRMLYLHGLWEPEVTALICAQARSGMTALDVGAYVGYYTLLLARRVGERGRVIAFEPNPAVRAVLERNVSLNGYRQVTICDYGLFSQAGGHSLEGPDSLQSRLAGPALGREIRVEAFDRCREKLGLQALDLVKLDVEGAELDVLQGMRLSLAEWHPALLVEVHPVGLAHFGHSTSQFLDFVRSFGYRVKPVGRETLAFSGGGAATAIFCR